MTAFLAWILIPPAASCACGSLYGAALGRADPGGARRIAGRAACGYAILALVNALARDCFGTGSALAVAVFWLWMWYRARRKRKRRSLKALGHKARARLAAMARNMPEPGPVLRPAPQGAPS